MVFYPQEVYQEREVKQYIISHCSDLEKSGISVGACRLCERDNTWVRVLKIE